MKTKITFLCVLLLTVTRFVVAQSEAYDPDQLIFDNDSANTISDLKPIKEKKRFDTGLGLGTSFSFSPNNFYGPAYYISPHISYSVSDRFLLTAGIMAEYSTLYPLYGTNNDNSMSPMMRTYLYASGSYLLTPRLSAHGTVYKSFNDVPRLTENGRPLKYNYQGIDIGVNYKLSEHFSVGFQVRMNDGYQNYYNSFMQSDPFSPNPGY